MREDIAYYNQALDYAKEEQWHEAKALLGKAIALSTDEAEYHSLLGVVYLGLRDNNAALAQFRVAYRLNKEDPLLQPYMLFLLFGEFGLDDYKPPTAFSGWDGRPPPNSGSAFPRKPKPLTPTVGAETLPDQGVSQIP